MQFSGPFIIFLLNLKRVTSAVSEEMSCKHTYTPTYIPTHIHTDTTRFVYRLAARGGPLDRLCPVELAATPLARLAKRVPLGIVLQAETAFHVHFSSSHRTHCSTKRHTPLRFSVLHSGPLFRSRPYSCSLHSSKCRNKAIYQWEYVGN